MANLESKLYTATDVHDSIESLQLTHGRNVPIAYIALLFISVAVVLSIFLVKVDVSVGAPGQIRPILERVSVVTPVDGRIQKIYISDNQPVKNGDKLMVIDSTSIDARSAQNQSQLEENTTALADLGLLILHASSVLNNEAFQPNGETPAILKSAPESNPINALGGMQYVRQWSLFIRNIQRLLIQRTKAQQNLARDKTLHDRGLESDLDFDQKEFNLDQLKREIALTVDEALSKWETERRERELARNELESQTKQLAQAKSLCTITAPVEGTALGFIGYQPGLYVTVGQRVGDISPSSNLQADVYVSTRDIGFIRQGQQVSLQVDAFPYTEWGVVKGHVKDISQDLVPIGQEAAFKVVVDVESTQLQSASGAIVGLRKGMAVNARFILKRRTLLDLLYGKFSESLDPTSSPRAE